MQIIKSLFLNSRKLFALSIMFGVFGGAFFIVLIGLVNYLIGKGAESAEVDFYKVIFVVFLTTLFFTNLYSQRIMGFLGINLTHDLILMLISRVLSTRLRKIEEVGASSLYASVTQDVQAIREAVIILPVIIVNSASLIAGLGYMLYLSWKFVFIQVALFLCLGLVAMVSARIIKVLIFKIRESQDDAYKHYQGFFYGIKELKADPEFADHFYHKKYVPVAEKIRGLSRKISTAFALSFSIYDTLFFIAIGFILLVTPLIVVVDYSVIAGMTMVLLFLRAPALTMHNAIPVLTRGNVSLRKIHSLTEAIPDEDGGGGNKVSALAPWRGLRLKNVEYEYQQVEGERAERFHLGPISLEVNPGEIVVVAGGNGAGKSTLAKIIAGLYSPTKGEVLLNEEPLMPENEKSISRYLSVIFSDFYLFSELAETLVDDERYRIARSLLKEMDLSDKVDFESGHVPAETLSMGQRKRLALLFSLASTKSIFLFDEWAADQDPEFRDHFYRVILPRLKSENKGVIVISHDDRYFNCADKLYVLERGTIRKAMSKKDAQVESVSLA